MTSRRDFIKKGAVLGAGSSLLSFNSLSKNNSGESQSSTNKDFWADGSKMLLSVSMHFESGGQVDLSESPFSKNVAPAYQDSATQSWYDYGYKEGIPRLLNIWDRFGIKVTCFMTGSAALKNPKLAKEIVQRGHEIAAQGMSMSSQYTMQYEEEKKFIQDSVYAIQQTTGVMPTGYYSQGLRQSENTLKILQGLNFNYHVNDLSRDEPFVIQGINKEFAVLPYTLRCNDLMMVEERHLSVDQFFADMTKEFDHLFVEAKMKRRYMSIVFHDRIGGSPQMIHTMIGFFQNLRFLTEAGLSYKRRDEIAQMVLADKTCIRE